EKEYRDHLFNWACEQIRDQFNESTWKAFWGTAVEGDKPADVADSLGISVGAVYIAKTRVTKKLRAKVATIDESI
ncbi:MAG: sigma-70 family RNA polymerase sigma factor, partial [Planctomycetota bacterium]